MDEDIDGKVKGSQLGAEWTAGQAGRTALNKKLLHCKSTFLDNLPSRDLVLKRTSTIVQNMVHILKMMKIRHMFRMSNLQDQKP